MIHAVIDNNVLVSAVITPAGRAGHVFNALKSGQFVMIYSPSLWDELSEVLQRPRIRARYRLGDADIDDLLTLITLHGRQTETHCTITACRDVKDNNVLEAAVAGNADVIVTADNDLLVLNPFQGIPIVGPAAFLKMLAGEALQGPESGG